MTLATDIDLVYTETQDLKAAVTALVQSMAAASTKANILEIDARQGTAPDTGTARVRVLLEADSVPDSMIDKLNQIADALK